MKVKIKKILFLLIFIFIAIIIFILSKENSKVSNKTTLEKDSSKIETTISNTENNSSESEIASLEEDIQIILSDDTLSEEQKNEKIKEIQQEIEKIKVNQNNNQIAQSTTESTQSKKENETTKKATENETTKKSAENDVIYVGGNISSDTVWEDVTKAYFVTEDVNIKNGVTLNINSGVTIIGNSHTINVYGSININGSNISYINIEDLSITGGQFGSNYYINMDHVKMTNGNLLKYGSTQRNGYIDIQNCIFSNINSSDWKMYIWYYPSVKIINNIFNDFGGMYLLLSDGLYDIKYNTFNRCQSTLFEVGPDSYTQANINFNNFYISGTVITNEGHANLDMSNNYWGTSNINDVPSHIRDGNTDYLLPCTVLYSPILEKAY